MTLATRLAIDHRFAVPCFHDGIHHTAVDLQRMSIYLTAEEFREYLELCRAERAPHHIADYQAKVLRRPAR